MRLIPLYCLKEGMVVGKCIYDTNGKVLLNKNSKMKISYISKLKNLGYSSIYIEDELSRDIEIKNVITDELKLSAVKTIKNTFTTTSFEHPRVEENYRFKETQLMVEKLIEEISSNKDMMINMVDMKVFDEYTFFHSVNVSVLAIVMGLALDLNKVELAKLGYGAMLHDIGKVFIDKEVLNKSGKLDRVEREIIEEHSEKGYKYVKKSLDIPAHVYLCCLQHHEKYDGTGYPNKLSGENISLFGRIISICDVYDALTSKRPYREALPPSEAIEYIMANGQAAFDEELIKVFIKKIAPYPLGTMVKLSNGLVGLVANNYEECCMRPKIKIIKNENDELVDSYYIDLRDDRRFTNITIVNNII